jgi:hypothetical protein
LLLIPLFWGSLWGVAEATLGHLLHTLRIPILPGALMFPLGVYFMVRAYMSSGKISFIFLTSLVAASTKLFDFFLPAQNLASVINPALAILSESLLVMLYFVIKREGEKYRSLTSLSSRKYYSRY